MNKKSWLVLVIILIVFAFLGAYVYSDVYTSNMATLGIKCYHNWNDTVVTCFEIVGY